LPLLNGVPKGREGGKIYKQRENLLCKVQEKEKGFCKNRLPWKHGKEKGTVDPGGIHLPYRKKEGPRDAEKRYLRKGRSTMRGKAFQ